MELGIGADADVGFAWSGGGDGAGADRAQGATGSSPTDRKICSTVSEGACSRSLSAAAAAARKDQRNLAASTIFAPLSRAREAAPFPARSDADRPAPAGSAGLRLPADVDISFWWNCCSRIRRRTMELGIGADADVGFAWSGGGDGAGADRAQGATGSSPTDRKICSTVSEGACSRSLSAAAAAARKDQRNLAASTIFAPLSRTREAAPFPARSDADRPAPAGSAGLRLPADVDISFWWNCCSRIRRRTMELGIGADADVGFAWSGGGDGAGADRAQGATGSSPTDRKICSTVSEGACSRSLSAAAAAARKDQRNLAASTIFAPLSRTREAAPFPARSDADRPAPAGSAGLRLPADVDISFWWNCCSRIRRRTMELGIGADADVGFAWSGGGDGAGADRAQGATGSSPTDRKICSTVSEFSVYHFRCPHARARGGGTPMMALAAAQCELRGGARQHSRFKTAVRGALMASLAERTASPWTATSMRDRPAGCSTCASSLCGAVCGNGRSPAAGVDGLLVAIGRRRGFGAARRRRGHRSSVRPARHSPPPDDIGVVMGWRPLTALGFARAPKRRGAGCTERSSEIWQRLPLSLPSLARARGWAPMMAGPAARVRATGWRATALPFQQLR